MLADKVIERSYLYNLMKIVLYLIMVVNSLPWFLGYDGYQRELVSVTSINKTKTISPVISVEYVLVIW